MFITQTVQSIKVLKPTILAFQWKTEWRMFEVYTNNTSSERKFSDKLNGIALKSMQTNSERIQCNNKRGKPVSEVYKFLIKKSS